MWPKLKGTFWFALLLAASLSGRIGRAEDYELHQAGSRVWVGSECVAVPMQDWSVEDGVIVGQVAADRTVSLMAVETSADSSFEANVLVDFKGKAGKPAKVRAGFRIGTNDSIGNWKRRALFPQGGVEMGVRADGRVFIDEQVGEQALAGEGPIQLSIRFDARSAKLTVSAGRGKWHVMTGKVVNAEVLTGGVTLIADGPNKRPVNGANGAVWRFSQISLFGAGIRIHRDHTFGPILWTQYTLSDDVLKLSVQMPPIGKADAQTVALQVKRGDGWETIGEASIDADARTALFKVADWPSDRDVPYRVSYQWASETHEWSGMIRQDPVKKATFDLAAFSCDNGYAFPAPWLVESVKQRDPDLLFFAGDQIYESYGGFGIVRSPVEAATLDYLRKWYQFGWTWGELMRNRPTIVIPDDHDVYQGNIWGAGGRAVPKGRNINWGGYQMPVRWVNMVQRTQTAHLPDAVDPAPLESGIGVYFTAMNYAGGRIAIIEDRKFKSGPSAVFAEHGISTPQAIEDVGQLDVPGAILLGDRQLKFLEQWGRGAKRSAFNVVLSQTMFAKVHTHGGPRLNRSKRDVDTNAWPQSGRNRALKVISKSGALMICGDQHFGALVRHGIEAHGDGPLAFMVPGTVNGWPRAAWPGVEQDNPGRVDVDPLGKRIDAFGHRIDVIGVGNPNPRSHDEPFANPQFKARAKGSGYGIVRFNKPGQFAVFELLRYPAEQGKPAENFPGFPITLPLDRVEAGQ